ncbi:AGL063Cp [Eremothecium gossypii ATCC 10895]|uniref:AGL063Cp n=1 Tax=Eremothecium gossypii (strain ATCC 10895 / CBS 109.51 / FGSC 9923 / NRRL Y-1056) TaxID=284811 RepID=Q750M0_EREGS|nr:AGL063Cp [Eremothecium gossypii ATCC 10895]AAS54427.2 AGL063Cp [Eremothecium gossypii ATCC 10895]
MSDNVVIGPSSQPHEREDTEQLLEQPAGPATGREAFKTKLRRHLDVVARHFNILDRLFKRQPGAEAGVQFGAHADGVFSNLTAKPDRGHEAVDGDKPPTYDEAAADVVPPYYGIDDEGVALYYNEICIDGLPVGNAVNFLWNLIISASFQFVGFLLTYILHTSHAARQGSRFGLGLTFAGYGYSMIPSDVTSKVGKDRDIARVELDDPNEFEDSHLYSPLAQPAQDRFESQLSHGLMEKRRSIPALAIVLEILGLAIMCKSVYDYIVVKRMERRFLTASDGESPA